VSVVADVRDTGGGETCAATHFRPNDNGSILEKDLLGFSFVPPLQMVADLSSVTVDLSATDLSMSRRIFCSCSCMVGLQSHNRQ
jgi:hypothetical protein